MTEESPPILPALLRGDEILLPLKVDVTIAGARVVDTFCWRLYNSYVTPDEFSWRLCSDQNLPLCFQPAIALQIYEQLTAFQEMLASIRLLLAQGIRPPWKSLMHMNIGIRHCTLDYSDKFQWDVLADTGITPEIFARTTCADLGLPTDMEPAIAHKIRENIFRSIITWLDDVRLGVAVEVEAEMPPCISDVKVNLVQPNHTVDMISNLWKRAKPISQDDIAGALIYLHHRLRLLRLWNLPTDPTLTTPSLFTAIPQPVLPVDRDSNASAWIVTVSNGSVAADDDAGTS